MSEKTAEIFSGIDAIVCNPPYLTADDMKSLQKEVTFEPETALFGGKDGLDFYRNITKLWKDCLKSGGILAYEIGMGQEDAVMKILEENNFINIEMTEDLSGIIRVVRGEKNLTEEYKMAKSDLKKKVKAIAVPVTKDEKKKALESAIAQIEKNFGKGAIIKLGANQTMKVDAIPTGSMGLDLALGIGGVPRGRIVELYGPESSGKTTVALHIIAEAQKQGGEVAFVDVEHALDPKYAAAVGVDVDNLLVSQPNSGEEALEIMEALVRSGAIDVVVLDSVAALTTKS